MVRVGTAKFDPVRSKRLPLDAVLLYQEAD